MFAIPASMLTWGFEAEAERMAKQSRKRAIKRREREESQSSGLGGMNYGSSSTSSFDSDDNTTDEEYFKLIAGEDDDDDDDSLEDPRLRELRDQFRNSDKSQDGNLTLSEFIALSDKNRWDSRPAGRDDLEGRLRVLEDSMVSTNAKLDRILQLLERQT